MERSPLTQGDVNVSRLNAGNDVPFSLDKAREGAPIVQSFTGKQTTPLERFERATIPSFKIVVYRQTILV